MSNVPETSKEAYRSLVPAELNEIYRQILKGLSEINEATFEELAAHIKVDKSRVWKRMSELERMELVYRPGNKRLLKSGRNGFTWMLRNSPRTDKELLKSTKPITEYAKNIDNIQKQVVQSELFQ